MTDKSVGRPDKSPKTWGNAKRSCGKCMKWTPLADAKGARHKVWGWVCAECAVKKKD